MRCDASEKRQIPNLKSFNPHTYMRCDMQTVKIINYREVFQSTHLHEVWRLWAKNITQEMLFQSTHLHEVWLERCKVCPVQNSFNPHTYMRCDGIKVGGLSNLPVSIHTPTWGVTKRFLGFLWKTRFQSTHLHEVWPKLTSIVLASTSFNPHTYMRCDANSENKERKQWVSIHTPTWGVTPTGESFSTTLRFNPHTYMRCDKMEFPTNAYLLGFNPHTYMRCDSKPIKKADISKCFNPHTYMRCDYNNRKDGKWHRVSIHTPTWGVTNGWLAQTCAGWFQSTHLHEVWQTTRNARPKY